jgi:hypothetical protein
VADLSIAAAGHSLNQAFVTVVLINRESILSVVSLKTNLAPEISRQSRVQDPTTKTWRMRPKLVTVINAITIACRDEVSQGRNAK